MRFTKMHGLGNDFLVVDDRRLAELPWPELARRWCARRTGVGADGLLLVQPGGSADLRLALFNADGSEGEMCGNGVRCTAVWAAERGIAGTSVTWETLAGPVATEVLGPGSVRVDMGPARLAAADIPVRVPPGGDPQRLRLSVDVGGATVELTGVAVGMGNPHLVVVAAELRGLAGGRGEGLDGLPAAELGAAVQRLDAFPRGVNVELVEVVSPRRFRQRTVERGVGETDACGTGACAALVALRHRGLLAGTGEVVAELRGGELVLERPAPAGGVLMTGPAVTVFEGQVDEVALVAAPPPRGR